MFDVLDYLAEEEKANQQPVSNVNPLSAPADETAGVCFEIDRGILKVLLERAIEVVPAKDILPVLKNFQFRVRGDKLSVVATNLNMSVISSTSMSVEATNGGVEVFPAKKLLEIVRESDASSRIYISVNGRTAIVVAGNASWEISLGRGTDFPKMPKVAAESLQKVDRAEFLRCLSTVRYAVGAAGRESLMLVNVKKGRFTACDGSRLQQARMTGFDAAMQIPGFAVDKLIKMLKASDLQAMQVADVDNRLIFKVGADTLLVNKTASTFPPLEDLWLRPALSNDQELVVEKDLLLAAIGRVKVNVDLEYGAVSVNLTPGKPGFLGELTLAASDGHDRAGETIPAQWYGPERELVLHFRYLKEALSSYAPDDCTFKLGEDQKTKKSPVLLIDPELKSMGIIQQMVGVPPDRRRAPQAHRR